VSDRAVVADYRRALASTPRILTKIAANIRCVMPAERRQILQSTDGDAPGGHQLPAARVRAIHFTHRTRQRRKLRGERDDRGTAVYKALADLQDWSRNRLHVRVGVARFDRQEAMDAPDCIRCAALSCCTWPCAVTSALIIRGCHPPYALPADQGSRDGYGHRPRRVDRRCFAVGLSTHIDPGSRLSWR